jgi:hypothetical protein
LTVLELVIRDIKDGEYVAVNINSRLNAGGGFCDVCHIGGCRSASLNVG